MPTIEIELDLHPDTLFALENLAAHRSTTVDSLIRKMLDDRVTSLAEARRRLAVAGGGMFAKPDDERAVQAGALHAVAELMEHAAYQRDLYEVWGRHTVPDVLGTLDSLTISLLAAQWEQDAGTARRLAALLDSEEQQRMQDQD